MNLVGIDISINSTGISILRDDEIILFNFTTTKKSYVWIKKTLEHIDFEFINYTHQERDNYSEKEIMKLREFDKVSDIIFNKVFGNIDKTQPTYIAIEGYNYGLKNTSSIIDIVTLSTLIRKKLLEGIPNLQQILILSPKSIKSKVCEMVYGKTTTEKINKKGVKKITTTINDSTDGVTGGNFQKHDMLKALVELNVDTKLTDFLKENKDDLLKMKNVPKPFDDIIDSIWIMLVLKDILEIKN
jgi:bacterioferritin (cytochrome b1)